MDLNLNAKCILAPCGSYMFTAPIANDCAPLWNTHCSHYRFERVFDLRFEYARACDLGAPKNGLGTPNYYKKQLNVIHWAPIDNK